MLCKENVIYTYKSWRELCIWDHQVEVGSISRYTALEGPFHLQNNLQKKIIHPLKDLCKY